MIIVPSVLSEEEKEAEISEEEGSEAAGVISLAKLLPRHIFLLSQFSII